MGSRLILDNVMRHPVILLAHANVTIDNRLSYQIHGRRRRSGTKTAIAVTIFGRLGMKSGRSALLAGILFAGSFATAFGQATNAGDISGSVTDNTGAAIPGATVTVLNIDTGVSKDYTTNGA